MTTIPDPPESPSAPGPPDLRTAALVTLALIGVGYTLYFARVFFLPVMVALLLNFLLRPAIRLLGRMHLPETVAAAVVMLLLGGALGLGVYTLAEPVQRWLTRAPQVLAEGQAKVRGLIKPMQQVNRAAAQVENATQAGAPAGGEQPQQVVVRGPSLAERIFGTTQSLLIGGFEVFILLYFLLAGGDFFLEKLVRALPTLADRRVAVSIAREVERAVSAYLGSVAMVNLALGLSVWGALALIGFPNPLLWGVAAAVLEVIPYVGAVTTTAILTLTGLVTFDNLGRALLAPGVFLAIDLVIANLFSPIVLGRRLTLNPVAIFVGLLFWTMVWGVPGALLAVPLLATMKILCDHIEMLKPVGEFLGR